MTSKPKSVCGGAANIAIVLLLFALGPVMIGILAHQSSADAELVRTGERATGTIMDFNDARQASKRDIDVEFQSADGRFHSVEVPVDHEQRERRRLPDWSGRYPDFIFWGIAFTFLIKSLVRAGKCRKNPAS